jgi:uncharacterized DUF497 family protein
MTALKVCYTTSVRFEWDPKKAATNAQKHGVTFAEAISAILDPQAFEEPDPVHADRVQLTGRSAKGRLLWTVYLEVRDDTYRIITARRAEPHERKRYEEGE